MSEITRENAIKWLNEAARYFEKRPTGGEDMAYWANISNAEIAKRIAKLIASSQKVDGFDLVKHIYRARAFSEKTFGPGRRTKGICEHIRKELLEIEAEPNDLEEWIDIIILGIDGAWRTGATPEMIVAALEAKQTKNEGRKWPDWRTMSEDQAIEHVRDHEVS